MYDLGSDPVKLKMDMYHDRNSHFLGRLRKSLSVIVIIFELIRLLEISVNSAISSIIVELLLQLSGITNIILTFTS